MRAVSVEHHRHRANDFFDGVLLLRGDPAYRYSAALLAIHAAISYSDALRTALGDEDLLAEDHFRAVQSLNTLLTANNLQDRNGLRHLSYLIAKKSLVAYRNERLDQADAESLITKAERFLTWANSSARKLKLEGWRS